jgi:hypothetical protein
LIIDIPRRRLRCVDMLLPDAAAGDAGVVTRLSRVLTVDGLT